MDLDNFPKNETALRMIEMVSPIYDKSYVGKWIFEVMGIQFGIADAVTRGILDEAFPDTATWTLPFWEDMYGVHSNPGASVEQRRKAILEVRNYKKPMNPARIEQLIKQATGRDAIVHENTAPYTYEVCIQPGETPVTIDEVIAIIKDAKQSNKHVNIIFETPTTVRIRAEPDVPGMFFPFVLAGTVPDVNTVGKTDDIGVAHGISTESNVFGYNAAGTSKAGTVPDTAVPGSISAPGLVTGITTTAGAAAYKVCGSLGLKRGG